MEPELVISSAQIDFELCELLGKGSADFIVLYADGEKMDFFGTPYDSPRNRQMYAEIVDDLNSMKKKGGWPDFFREWKGHFCKRFDLPADTTAETYHPKISMKISRVCHGYSVHLHAAIGLFDEVSHMLKFWNIGKTRDGKSRVEIETVDNRPMMHSGDSMPLVIVQVITRLLKSPANANCPSVGATDKDHE
jgi:hypothetical protein